MGLFSSKPKGDAVEWNDKGVLLGEQGDAQNAMECFDRALEINPNYAEAWHNKGSLYYKQGDTENAMKCFDRVLEIDPNDAEAWLKKGALYVKQGDAQNAIECFDRVLEIDPNNKDAKEFKKIAIEESSIKDIEESSVNKTTKITEDNPMKILKMRLAKGEITEEEFTRLKSLLE